MGEYQVIRNVNKDNFLFGGLLYHHMIVLDYDERDKEFQKQIEKKRNNGKPKNKYLDDVIEEGEVSIENLYSIKAELNNIKNSQSLSEFAMNKTLQYFSNEPEEYPMDQIYSSKKHSNAFIDNDIKILESDVVIFISFKGVLGDIFDKDDNNQKLVIRYKFDDKLQINIGEVYDLKLIEDFLGYDTYIEELEDK